MPLPPQPNLDFLVTKIFYSMAGEGRGHAARVRTMVEALRARHQFVLLAPDDAFEFLSRCYEGSEVEVRRWTGLRFVYDDRQRVHWPRTFVAGLRYQAGSQERTAQLAASMRAEGAELLVTDYDPGGPRAAQRAGIPYVALDHQSLFNFGDLSFLPMHLRRKVWTMGRFGKLLYHRQIHTISSSFFRPEPRRDAHNVTFVGTLLRPALLQAPVTAGDHLTAYCRRDMPANVLETLRCAGREVRVYGLGEHPDDGDLRFRPISEDGFLADLASAHAVVASAGNQLIGECLYLGKPVLALPELGQDEQAINGVLLERMGGGRACRPDRLTPAILREFLGERDRFGQSIDREFAHGLPAAEAALEAILQGLG